MDPASIAIALISGQTAQLQMAVAAQLLKMNADQGQSVAQLLDAASSNANRLANVASGIGGNLDITV